MLRFRLLGCIEAEGADGLIHLGGIKQRAVLAMLLLDANRTVSDDRLIDGLWADHPPETARHGLRVYVCNLRRALYAGDAETLATSGSGYVLRIDASHIDVTCFQALVHGGLAALQGGDRDAARRLLQRSLDLWRGPALDGLRHQPFAEPHIAHLEELQITAHENRITADMMLGHHAQSVGELEHLVKIHPWRESLWSSLMQALSLCGRRAEALAAYNELESLLHSDLGVEPSPALQQLRAEMLAAMAPSSVRTRKMEGLPPPEDPR